MSAAPSNAAPLDVAWIHGSVSSKHNTDPDLQVYRHDERSVILRQNKAIDYEAPFLYLLTGTERSVLIDTGATVEPQLFPLRQVVDELIGDGELLVLHTHGHGDHIAADGQFADRPRTTVIGPDLDSVQRYFAFAPGKVAHVDLGSRVLDAIHSPGHEVAAVTYFDPQTGWLLTGDTVYRGRLYVRDWPAFVDSLDRMVAFAEARPVSHVLGCHIEMTTTPGLDYPVRTTYQPDEPPLEMSVDQLRQVQSAAHSLDGSLGSFAYDDFIITVVAD